MEVSESTIDGIVDVIVRWDRKESSSEVAMHEIWNISRNGRELNAKLPFLVYLQPNY